MDMLFLGFLPRKTCQYHAVPGARYAPVNSIPSLHHSSNSHFSFLFFLCTMVDRREIDEERGMLLEIVAGPLKGERRRIQREGASIGRAVDNTIRLARRRHCHCHHTRHRPSHQEEAPQKSVGSDNQCGTYDYIPVSDAKDCTPPLPRRISTLVSSTRQGEGANAERGCLCVRVSRRFFFPPPPFSLHVCPPPPSPALVSKKLKKLVSEMRPREVCYHITQCDHTNVNPCGTALPF